tara:strand:- start:1654 stop:2364 length:711 start_codon:yes stop_codon:yes gene_type:complete
MTVVYFLEGNIGTGKSTLLEALEDMPGPESYQLVREPLDAWQGMCDDRGNSILQLFYDDPKRHAYTFQTFALLTRVKALSEIDTRFDAVFVERSIESDALFAMNCYDAGYMNSVEWKVYLQLYQWAEDTLASKLGSVERVHLYLRCAPETSYERLLHRNRSEETELSMQYLRDIHAKHEERFIDMRRGKAVVVDAGLKIEEVASRVVQLVLVDAGLKIEEVASRVALFVQQLPTRQ